MGETSDENAPGGMRATVIRGVSLAALGYVLAQAINLIGYIVLARLLSPGEFGQFAAATVLVSFTLLLTESGMGAAVVQRRGEVESAASTAVVATILAGIAFSGVAAGLAPLIGGFFNSSEITVLAAASAGLIFLRTVSVVPDAMLQRRFSFLRRLVVEPIQVTVFAAVSIALAAGGLGVWALVIGQYAGFAVSSSLAWILARWRPDFSLASFATWREMADYGRHIVLATAVLRVGDQLNVLAIGRLLGTSALGQFNYALRLAATPFAMLLAGAAYVLFPAMSRIADDRDRLRAAFLTSLRWMTALGLSLGLLFLPFGESIAVIVFGEVWRPAGLALAAMSLLTIGGMLSSVVSEALKARGTPRPLTGMHVVSTALTIGPMLLLVSDGLTAASASISIGAVVGGVYSLWVFHRVEGCPLRALARQLIPALLAGALMLLASWPISRALPADEVAGILGVALLAGELIAALAVFALVYLSIARDARGEARLALRRLHGRQTREPVPTDDEALDHEPTIGPP